MKNIYKIKQIIIIILIIIIIGAIYLSIKSKETIVPVDNTIVNTEPEEIKSISLCYYRGDKTTSRYYDVAWLKINTMGSVNDKVIGEFQNLPAEKDSKIGTFEGTVGPVNQKNMARSANVWWNSFAEGMNNKEELIIEFGDGSASAGFGEMIDKGDGVYVYEDKTNLTYGSSMGQIDCDYLNEKLFVEKYIKDNIKTIATNKPVLGGSWYVVSVYINPSTHTGEVTYEDGHIQSKASVTYTYQKDPQSVAVTKFEFIK